MEFNFINKLTEKLQEYVLAFIDWMPKLAIATVVLILTFFIAGMIQRFATKRIARQMDDPLLARFLARILRMVLIIVGIAVALRILDLGGAAGSVIAGAGLSAFVIGFAFKDIGENLLAGVMLAFSRPFRVGDTVETGGFTAKVVRLNLRNTQLKTFDGKDVFIPNSILVKEPMVNYTLDGFLRYDFVIGLDYDSDIKEAQQIILNMLATIPSIYKDREASVSVDELTSSTINLKGFYWLNRDDPQVSPSETHVEIIDKVLGALTDAGFNMPGDIMEIKSYKDKELPIAQKSNGNENKNVSENLN